MIKKFIRDNAFILVIITAMIGFVLWRNHTTYTGVDTGSKDRTEVNTRNALSTWDELSGYYKIKTGTSLTYKETERRLEDPSDKPLTDVVTLNSLLNNPDKALLRKYQVSGMITSKVRVSNSPVDYVTLSTRKGYVRVYYFFDLPYEDNGDNITITGIVLGKPDDKRGDITSFVSTSGFTSLNKATVDR